MLHANFTAVCFTEAELLSIKIFHSRNRNFRPFLLLCDLGLDPMTFIYERDPYNSPEMYRMCDNELTIRQGFGKLSSDSHTYIQTDRQTDKTEIIYHAASRVVIVTPLFRFGVDLMYTAGWCDQALF